MNKSLFSISVTIMQLNCPVQLCLAAPPSKSASVQHTLVKVTKTKASGKTAASAMPLVDYSKLQQLDASYRVSDRADKALQQGNWVKAKLLYQQAQAVWPTNDEAFYGLGQCAAHDGDLQTAIADYRINIYSHSDSVYGTVPGDGYASNDNVRLLEFALLLSQAGEADEAATVYNRGIGFYNYEDGVQHASVLLPEFGTGPDQMSYNASLLQAMAHAALSMTVLHFDDVAALSHVRQAAALAPDNPIVQFYLGDCLRCATYYPNGTSFSADIVARNQVLAKAAFAKAAQSGNGQVQAAIKERQH